MKTLRYFTFVSALAAVACLFSCAAAHAQTNSAPQGLVQTASGDLGGDVNQIYLDILNSSVLQATNWAVAPYVTYAPKAANKVGGGLLAVYNVPALTSTNIGAVGFALGADWLGSWSLVSGSATIQVNTHPFGSSWFSWLPASVTSISATPFAIAGIGSPISGSAGAATLWDLGYAVNLYSWQSSTSKQEFTIGTGFTWGAWDNAGAESGHRYHFPVFIKYNF